MDAEGSQGEQRDPWCSKESQNITEGSLGCIGIQTSTKGSLRFRGILNR